MIGIARVNKKSTVQHEVGDAITELSLQLVVEEFLNRPADIGRLKSGKLWMVWDVFFRGLDRDALSPQELAEFLAEVRVHHGNEARHHFDERDFRAEAVEDVSELDPDRAAAEHEHGLGHVRGHDRVVGLTLELIPENDPLALAAGDELTVRAEWRGQPLPGLLLHAFRRGAEGPQDTMRTDEAGRAKIRLDTPGTWLISGVHMTGAASSEADWESTWSSLTFVLR